MSSRMERQRLRHALNAEEEERDILNPRNFYNNLYQDDSFKNFKEKNEEAVVEQAKQEVERKHFLSEMDDCLKDLHAWRKQRK